MTQSSRPQPPPRSVRPGAVREPMSFVAGAAWTIAVLFALQSVLLLAEGVREGAIGDLVSQTGAYAFAYLMMTFVMLRLYEPESSIREVLAVRKASVAVVLLAIVIGVTLYPALSWVDTLIEKRFPISDEEAEMVKRLLRADTFAHRANLVTALLVVIPACEELFFRGFLFGGLLVGRKANLVIFVTAFYFAASIGDPREFLPMLAFGMLLGWLRLRSESVVVSYAAHVGYFAPSTILLLLHNGVDEGEVPMRWTLVGVGIAVACTALVFALTRKTTRAIV